MKSKFSIALLALLFTISTTTLLAQTYVYNSEKTEEKSTFNDPKMDWWKEARFGMFIHWGLYAVPAGTYNGKKVPGIGEWIMNRGKIPVTDYKNYASQFNPVKYNAEEWVKMAKDAGVRYIVLTSKHHDGFAMFKSAHPFNIVDATPFKRDAVKELADACKKYNMKFGLYYSQAQDWTEPGGAANGGHWDSAQNGSMSDYIYKKSIPQIKEILEKYNPTVLWFDTPTGMNQEYADKILEVLKKYPNLIYNNRLAPKYKGDLETPEQYIPATGYPGKNWESCMTMNNTWGFKSDDTAWKSSKDLISNLIDVASKGGNYLLNVGPTSEGLIPAPSVKRLKTMGTWLKTNGQAIYGTTASPFAYLKLGRCTRKKEVLYFHILRWPTDGVVRVPMYNTVVKATLLAAPKFKVISKKVGKYIEFKLPKKAIDSVATVLAVQIKGEPIPTIADPIPSTKKKATASSDSTKPSLAFDGNGRKGWMAKSNEKTGWLAVDLGKPTSIGSISMAEAGTFDKFVKHFRLEYKEGNDWKTVFEDNTIGAGYFKAFKPVVAQEFRINILETTKTPQLKEVQLYYDE